MDDHLTDDQAPLLPWWHSKLNLSLCAIVVALLGAVIGYTFRGTDAMVEHNRVDVGFLQDMRIHHEQAVTMSVVYLGAAPEGTPLLRQIAKEISFDQSTENGRMAQTLRMFRENETNPSDLVMGWMGAAVDLSQMPGYATDAELDALYKSRNAEADKIFATLMIAHHEGALHMAEYARDNGVNPEVRALCESIIDSQTSEIGELRKILAQL